MKATYRHVTPLAQHFRETKNAWQTVEEIADATGLPVRKVRSFLNNASTYLEKRGAKPHAYRFLPSQLYALKSERDMWPWGTREFLGTQQRIAEINALIDRVNNGPRHDRGLYLAELNRRKGELERVH